MNADERAARLDELCNVDGPHTVDEAEEFRRLAAEERFERSWGTDR